MRAKTLPIRFISHAPNSSFDTRCTDHAASGVLPPPAAPNRHSGDAMDQSIADGMDCGRSSASGVGAERSAKSYRAGGWWFRPDWLPDASQHDTGSFPTCGAALAYADEAGGAADQAQEGVRPWLR